MVIRTGDGKEYRPLWMPTSQSKEYNVTEFQFPNISGSLVDKRRPKGIKIPLELHFQGDDHITLMNEFMASADDPRPWTLVHPIYGRKIVQPTSIEVVSSKYNTSQINTEVIETITVDYPKTSVVPADKIAADADRCNALLIDAITDKIGLVGIKPASVNKSLQFVNKSDARVSPLLSNDKIAQDYFNELATAQAAVNTFSDNANTAVSSTVRLLQTTAALPISMNRKMDTYTGIITDAQNSILAGTIEQIDKFQFMTNIGATLSAMCIAAIRPISGDYYNRNNVLETVGVILTANTTYINTLDSLQTGNGGAPDSFLPDADAMQQLGALINYTVSNLFNIALDAKQERSIILETDSNWIVLAHRFYGLQADDSTIEEMIRNNNAGLSEMLTVQKNRKITYYV